MKKAFVTVGVGHWYPRGIERLRESIKTFHSDGDVDLLDWSDKLPPGAVPHSESMYGFKTHALMEARKEHDLICWIDCSCFLVRNTDKLWDIIEQDGYLFCDNGWKMGEWCSDSYLEVMNLTREESMEIPELTSYLVGLRTSDKQSMDLLDRWHSHSVDKHFNGFHTNSANAELAHSKGAAYREVGWCSDDPRVLGCRHDQSFLTSISWSMNMKKRWYRPFPVDYVNSWEEPKEQTYIVSRGM